MKIDGWLKSLTNDEWEDNWFPSTNVTRKEYQINSQQETHKQDSYEQTINAWIKLSRSKRIDKTVFPLDAFMYKIILIYILDASEGVLKVILKSNLFVCCSFLSEKSST